MTTVPDHLAPFLIDRARLREFALEACEHAKTLTADRPKSLTPSLLVLTKEHPEAQEQRAAFLLAVPFNEHEEKHDAVFAMGVELYGMRTFPLAVALTSEAWCAPDREGGRQPRDHPERREVVIVQALALDRTTALLFRAPVSRDSRERMTLGGFEEVEAAKLRLLLVDRFYQGFFAGFLSWAQEKGVAL